MRIHGNTSFIQKRACPTPNPPGINHPHTAATAACTVRIEALEKIRFWSVEFAAVSAMRQN